jgi:hypothetical protein
MIGDAPGHVRAGIASYLVGPGIPAPPPAGFPSAELVGVCALILPYIIRAGGPTVAYAKQIAPLMARTSFGRIFVQDVPAPEVAWLAGAGAAQFRQMWTQILLNTPGGGGGLPAPLFATDPGAAVGATLPAALTRDQWLTDIAAGTDRLTAADIPAVAAAPLTAAQAARLNQDAGLGVAIPGAPPTAAQTAWLTQYRRDQVFGLGGFGPAHDFVPPGPAARDAPLLELRRMRPGVDAHEFTEIALGLFDYIRALNAAGAPGAPVGPYQRGVRAVAAPSVVEQNNFRAA